MDDTHEHRVEFGEGIQSDDVQITFLEKANTADNSIEGIATRTEFTGHFAIDGYVLQYNDGRYVDAGLGADFDEYNGPTRAWVWFSAPVNDAVKEAFEGFFSAEFGEDRLRMELDPETFLKFADSSAWGEFTEGGVEEEEEDDLSGFLG